MPVVVAPTALLGPGVLPAVRRLLFDAFEGGLADSDWEHCLGGLHALVWEGSQLVGHGALVSRRLLHGGRALRTGWVEGVGVRPDARRRGHGGLALAALERLAVRAYDLAALSTSEQGLPFYASRGWRAWRGPTSVLSPDGVLRTPDDDGSVLVLPGSVASGVEVDLDGPLTCDWRDGDPW